MRVPHPYILGKLISHQRLYQIRNNELGLCIGCGRKSYQGLTFCLGCARKKRLSHRKKTGYKGRSPSPHSTLNELQ